MIYTLRKYIDWGPEHADEFPSAWHYISSLNKWDTSWSQRISNAIIFDSRDEALSFKLKHSAILGEDNSKHVELFTMTDMEYFIARLKGK